MLRIEKEEYINKTFRISKKQINSMQKICGEKDISMNKLISIFIEYSLSNLEKEK